MFEFFRWVFSKKSQGLEIVLEKELKEAASHVGPPPRIAQVLWLCNRCHGYHGHQLVWCPKCGSKLEWKKLDGYAFDGLIQQGWKDLRGWGNLSQEDRIEELKKQIENSN